MYLPIYGLYTMASLFSTDSNSGAYSMKIYRYVNYVQILTSNSAIYGLIKEKNMIADEKMFD